MKNASLGKYTYSTSHVKAIAVSSNPSKQSEQDYRAKAAQLIISLKFHYGKTLAELPLDVAVDAMVKVWESCQPPSHEATRSSLMSDRPRRVAPSSSSPADHSFQVDKTKRSRSIPDRPQSASPPKTIHL